jgi:hypothetical protein
MFIPTLQELLNILKNKLKKIQQNQYLIKIEVHFGIREVIKKKKKPKVRDILIFESFLSL